MAHYPSKILNQSKNLEQLEALVDAELKIIEGKGQHFPSPE